MSNLNPFQILYCFPSINLTLCLYYSCQNVRLSINQAQSASFKQSHYWCKQISFFYLLSHLMSYRMDKHSRAMGALRGLFDSLTSRNVPRYLPYGECPHHPLRQETRTIVASIQQINLCQLNSIAELGQMVPPPSQAQLSIPPTPFSPPSLHSPSHLYKQPTPPG